MSLFKRKSRATRRAEARAIKAKRQTRGQARCEERGPSHQGRSIKAETRALKSQLKAQRDSDKAALKVAETQLKAAREGKLFSPRGFDACSP